MKDHPLAAQCLSTRPAGGIPWAAALLALTVQASGAEATLVVKAKQFFRSLTQDMASGLKGPQRVKRGHARIFL